VQNIAAVVWPNDPLDFCYASPDVKVRPSDAKVIELFPSETKVFPKGPGWTRLVANLLGYRTRIKGEMNKSDQPLTLKASELFGKSTGFAVQFQRHGEPSNARASPAGDKCACPRVYFLREPAPIRCKRRLGGSPRGGHPSRNCPCCRLGICAIPLEAILRDRH